MKVIIAGGREFTNYDFVEKECNNILKNLAEPIEIVSGLARGVDTLAINYLKIIYNGFNIPISYNG